MTVAPGRRFKPIEMGVVPEMETNRPRWIVVFVAVFALVLAACGEGPSAGNDGDEGAQPAGDEGEQAQYDQGVTDDTIKIGMFAPFTGDAAVFGKGSHTIESIYKEINEAGGINGRKLELVIEDSQCDPATLKLAVRRLIEREKVFMLHGGMCSNANLNVLPDIQSAGLPWLIMASAAEGLVDPPSKNVFHGWANQTGGTSMNAEMVVSFIKETGNNRVALVAMPDEWGQGWAEGFKRDLEEISAREDVEVDLVAEAEIPEETGDATPSVRAVQRSDADIAVVYAYPQPMSVFLRDAHAQGLDIPKLTGQGTFVEDQLERVGNREAVTNFFSSYCQAAPLDSPEMDRYREALEKHYPRDVFDNSAMLGVSGADINVEILTQMGDDLTWENWIATAEQLQDFETPGAPSPVSYGPLDEEDPQTRIAAGTCRAAHVPLDDKKDSELVVVDPNWSEWTSIRDDS